MGIVKQGYLFKKSANRMMTQWHRRVRECKYTCALLSSLTHTHTHAHTHIHTHTYIHTHTHTKTHTHTHEHIHAHTEHILLF